MACRLYIGNLAWKCTDDDLREAFGRFGTVKEVVIIKDKETGKSKGFGFVEMESDGAAEEAIKTMNGAEFLGRPVTVNEAKARR